MFVAKLSSIYSYCCSPAESSLVQSFHGRGDVPHAGGDVVLQCSAQLKDVNSRYRFGLLFRSQS